MASGGENAPAWLFSFVDFAFLLLIALTQVGGDPRAVNLGEMVVPRVSEAAATALPAGGDRRWQLRVHPPATDAAGPFELLAPGSPEGEAARLAAPALRDRLAQLLEARAGKPLLAPHQDSRSQDLLDAIALIEERWPDGRRTAVSPQVARR
jgi:hypothetical protein